MHPNSVPEAIAPQSNITPVQFAVALALREQADVAHRERNRVLHAEVVTTANMIAARFYIKSQWKVADKERWTSLALGLDEQTS